MVYVEKQNVKKIKNTYPLAEVKDLNKEYLEQKVLKALSSEMDPAKIRLIR